jgi:DNA replication factor GINS
MYAELYAAWRLEIENGELGSLPSDFYQRIAQYMRKIKEETQLVTDKAGVKANLLERERANVARLAQELIAARCRKLAKMMVAGKKAPADSLTAEETQFYNAAFPSAEAFNKFAAGILQGQTPKIEIEPAPAPVQASPVVVPKRVTVRFLKPVPAIMGSDMQSYGPFLVEDVASVPVENAKVLVKQGLAKQVEFQ